MIFTHFSSQLCRHHGQLALLQSFFSQASGIQLGTDCLSLLLGTLAFLSAKTDKKRDYMLYLDNALVIGGEDRPMRGEMYVAQSKLFEKHKGANAALYGDLGYIIMIATAGECAKVFALDVRQGAHLQLLVEEFEMKSLSGRRKVLHLFINLTRWLHTVHTLCLLPPPPPARLMEPFHRPSPYAGKHIMVNGVKQLMKHPMDDVNQQTRHMTYFVQLRLHPVGARVSL
ncbi:TPA: hypothetical protein ACH3X3_008337 [Trebouxia sp. C0006]